MVISIACSPLEKHILLFPVPGFVRTGEPLKYIQDKNIRRQYETKNVCYNETL